MHLICWDLLHTHTHTHTITDLILSKLDYCNALYINLQKRLLNKLQILQNAAARLLAGIPKCQSISQALVQFHWLAVYKHIDFKALCTAFKALHRKSPVDLQKKFIWYTPPRALHSVSAHSLVTPKSRRARWGVKTLFLARFTIGMPCHYILKSCTSLSSFRKNLKTWVFNLG